MSGMAWQQTGGAANTLHPGAVELLGSATRLGTIRTTNRELVEKNLSASTETPNTHQIKKKCYSLTIGTGRVLRKHTPTNR